MNGSAHSSKPGSWLAYWTNAGLAVTFFGIGVISRIPFRSQLLYHWDSVNFALGMERFDVRMHQPHPPGYLLYILLGRLVNLLVGDANASLVWISVVFGGMTASVVYLLGRRLFGQREASIAALFALTSPAFWFYGEVALTYALEAFFVTAIALACLETLRGNWRMALLSALLMGLAGGIRQTTLILMLPLWLFSLRRCGWRVIFIAIFLLGLTVMAWLVPTIILSGGVVSYLAASRSVGGGVLSNFELFGSGQSLLTLLAPFVRLGMYVVYGLMLGLVPLLYGTIRGLDNSKTWLRHLLSEDRFHVIALWLVPNMVLYAPLVRAPGHTFSFMPALLLMAAAALVMLSRDLSYRLSWPSTRSMPALISLMLVVNVAFFLAAPPYLFGVRRVVTTTPSWPTIHYRDQYLAERVAYIRQHFDATTTVILTTGLDYRHPYYYLRDYYTLNQDTELLSSDVPARSQILVFFGDNLTNRTGDVQSVVLPSGGLLFYSRLDTNSTISVDKAGVSAGRSQAR
jgi:4-amino-4-deoxy-L-arabinose transferase-like glycosyltransferase